MTCDYFPIARRGKATGVACVGCGNVTLADVGAGTPAGAFGPHIPVAGGEQIALDLVRFGRDPDEDCYYHRE